MAIYHDPDLPPSHHYLAAYRWLDEEFGADAVVHLGKHGTLEWLPGKGLGLSRRVRAGRGARRAAAGLPVHRQRPGRGHAGQAPRARRGRRPPGAADGPRRHLRRDGQAGAAARRVRHRPGAGPGQAAGAARADLGGRDGRAAAPRPARRRRARGGRRSTTSSCTSTATSARSRTSRSATGCTSWAAPRPARPRSNLVLSILRATQVWGGQRALPGLRAALAAWAGLDEQALLAPRARRIAGHPRTVAGRPPAARRRPPSVSGTSCAGSAKPLADTPDGARLLAVAPGPAVTGADLVDVLEGVARALVAGCRRAGGPSRGRVRRAAGGGGARRRRGAGVRLPPRSSRGWTAPPTRSRAVLHALDGGYVPAGPSGSPTRGLVNVLPTGRNFYSVDPKAIPSRSAWEVGSALADSLRRPAPRRHRGVPAQRRAHRVGHRAPCAPRATTSPRSSR